jgi:hypothetical protein
MNRRNRMTVKGFKSIMKIGRHDERNKALQNFTKNNLQNSEEAKKVLLNVALHDQSTKVMKQAVSLCNYLGITYKEQKLQVNLIPMNKLKELKNIDVKMINVFKKRNISPNIDDIRYEQLIHAIRGFRQLYPHESDLVEGRMTKVEFQEWMKKAYSKYKEYVQKNEMQK